MPSGATRQVLLLRPVREGGCFGKEHDLFPRATLMSELLVYQLLGRSFTFQAQVSKIQQLLLKEKRGVYYFIFIVITNLLAMHPTKLW